MNTAIFAPGSRDETSPHDLLLPSSRGFPGEADEPAAFDLRRTVEILAADRARRDGASDLVVDVRYALGTPQFLIGPGDRIRQVLTRLVDRAVTLASAFEPRSRVLVDVQGDECADGCAAMRLRVEVAGPGGRGEPPASRRRDSVEPGPVSALADCRRLVELMGGRLGALTDPDKGSFVWLAMKLPVDVSRRRGAPRARGAPR